MAEEIIVISDSVFARGSGRSAFGIEARIRAAGARNSLLLRDAVDDIGTFAQFAAKRAVKSRTGNLERNVTFVGPDPFGTGGWKGDLAIRKGARYGRFVALGTGFHDSVPHWILPRKGQVMRWVESGSFATPYSGRFVIHSVIGPGRFAIFALRTRGQKAQPFMRTAWLETRTTYLRPRIAHLAQELGKL